MKKILLHILTFAAVVGFSLGNIVSAATTITLADNDPPPGLQGKGGAEFPKGLEKNEKTPEGWTHGEKKGWDHNSNHHSHQDHQGHHKHHHNTDNDND